VTLSFPIVPHYSWSRIARTITERDDSPHVRFAHGKIRALPASRSRSIIVSIHEESFFPGITAEASESLARIMQVYEMTLKQYVA